MARRDAGSRLMCSRMMLQRARALSVSQSSHAHEASEHVKAFPAVQQEHFAHRVVRMFQQQIILMVTKCFLEEASTSVDFSWRR